MVHLIRLLPAQGEPGLPTIVTAAPLAPSRYRGWGASDSVEVGPGARPVPGPQLVDIHRFGAFQSSHWGRQVVPIRDRNQPADQFLMIVSRAVLATPRLMVLMSTGMSIWGSFAARFAMVSARSSPAIPQWSLPLRRAYR